MSSQAWRSEALCVGMPTELFFPGRGKKPEGAELCRRCPVRVPCARDGLEQPSHLDFGIWGGMTPRDRRGFRADGPGGKKRRTWSDEDIEIWIAERDAERIQKTRGRVNPANIDESIVGCSAA